MTLEVEGLTDLERRLTCAAIRVFIADLESYREPPKNSVAALRRAHDKLSEAEKRETPSGHAPDCPWHLDQYGWECTCGAQKEAEREWFELPLRKGDE